MMDPDYTNQEWNIREADNCVRAVLSLRHDIDHYYTSLEKYYPKSDHGVWKHVKNSAVGHAKDKEAALSRIKKLIQGDWQYLMKNKG